MVVRATARIGIASPIRNTVTPIAAKWIFPISRWISPNNKDGYRARVGAFRSNPRLRFRTGVSFCDRQGCCGHGTECAVYSHFSGASGSFKRQFRTLTEDFPGDPLRVDEIELPSLRVEKIMLSRLCLLAF